MQVDILTATRFIRASSNNGGSAKMADPRESMPRTLPPPIPIKAPDLGWNDVGVWQKVQAP